MAQPFIQTWRITRSKYADKNDAFSGKGAAENPGRWNKAGVATVYTCSSIALHEKSRTQDIGDNWVKEATHAVLKVPSIITGEPNYLLNPKHPDFSRIAIDNPKIFRFIYLKQALNQARSLCLRAI